MSEYSFECPKHGRWVSNVPDPTLGCPACLNGAPPNPPAEALSEHVCVPCTACGACPESASLTGDDRKHHALLRDLRAKLAEARILIAEPWIETNLPPGDYVFPRGWNEQAEKFLEATGGLKEAAEAWEKARSRGEGGA